MDEQETCEVCGISGETTVAASSLGPASFAYCSTCIKANAEPLMMIATRIFVAGGLEDADLDNLADVVTFAGGRYAGLDTVVSRYDGLKDDIREAFFG